MTPCSLAWHTKTKLCVSSYFYFRFLKTAASVCDRPGGRNTCRVSTAHCEIKAVSRGVTLSTHTCRWLTFPAGLTGGRVNGPASKSLQECAACRTDASRTPSLASSSQQSLWMSTAFLPHPLLTSFSPSDKNPVDFFFKEAVCCYVQSAEM